MGKYTRIQSRFRGYTRADCACKYCLYYIGGRRKGCSLQRCCCEEERMEAAKMERQNEKMWRKFSQNADAAQKERGMGR